MRRMCILLFLVLIPFLVSADKKKDPQELFNEVKDEWILDENGSITFSKVIEVNDIEKDELYTRALSYFTYNYNSGDDVIQVKDKEKGLIIGKGIYANVYTGGTLAVSSFSIPHILRVDIKDSKIRVIITIQEYKVKVSGGKSLPSYPTFLVSQRFPFKKDFQKKIMCHVIYNTIQCVKNSFTSIEKSLKEGNTNSGENDDW